MVICRKNSTLFRYVEFYLYNSKLGAQGWRVNTMWEDPIVKETRKLREQYASKFKYDSDAIFEDILKRQEKSGRKRVAFPVRKPKSKQNVA